MKHPALILTLLIICFSSLVFLGNTQAQHQIPPFPPYYPPQWPLLYPPGGELISGHPEQTLQPNLFSPQNMMDFYLMQYQISGFLYMLYLASSSLTANSYGELLPILSYIVETDKSIYDTGDPVIIAFKVRNEGTEDVTIDFSTNKRCDVTIENKYGEEIWKHSAQTYTPESPQLLLKSNQSEIFEVTWYQNDNINTGEESTGTYIIKARLTSTEGQYNEEASKRIAIRSSTRLSNCEHLKTILAQYMQTSSDPNSTENSNNGGNGSGHQTDPPNVPWKSYVGIYGGFYGGYGAMGYAYAAPYAFPSMGAFIGGGYPAYGVSGTFMYSAALPSTGADYAAYGGGYGAMGYAAQAAYTGAGYAALGGYGAMGYATALPSMGAFQFQAYQPSYGMLGAQMAMPYTGSGGYLNIGGYAPLSTTSYTGLYASPLSALGGYGSFNTFASGYSTAYSFSQSTALSGSINYSYTQPSFSYGQIRYKEGNDGNDAPDNPQTVGDFITHDGPYICIIKNKTIRIIITSPEGPWLEVDTIDFTDTDFTPLQLYVHGNILVIIGTEPRGQNEEFTKIFLYEITYLYDVTNPANYESIREFKFEADFLQSRKVGNTLCVIMSEKPPIDLDSGDLVPIYSDSKYHNSNEYNTLCNCDEISYFPDYIQPNYLIVVGIPLSDIDQPISRELILSESEKVYASSQNLYVTSRYDEENSTSTLIYKFSFDEDESIKYMRSEKVSGKVINQQSMNENNDHFRVITTNGSTSGNIYIFDQDLMPTGSLEDIVGGESVTSICFMEDQCYLVRINDTTPFHVISLEDPLDQWSIENSGILGDCEYLHPYDAQHIIGFSKNGSGAGHEMTISLFNVADISAPLEIDKHIVYEYLDTNIDYRGFLLDKRNNLMAFPMSFKDNNQNIRQGAYILDLDENGFNGGPPVTHEDAIKRIIVSNDHYYTISNSMIKAFRVQGHAEAYEDILD